MHGQEKRMYGIISIPVGAKQGVRPGWQQLIHICWNHELVNSDNPNEYLSIPTFNCLFGDVGVKRASLNKSNLTFKDR